MAQVELYWTETRLLDRDDCRWMASRENPLSPLHRVIGQNRAVAQVERILFKGFTRANHRVSDLNIAWTGPAGTGKTMFAKAIAKALDLPFIEINPQKVKSPTDVFYEMQAVLSKVFMGRFQPVSLEMTPQEDGSYFAPSCVVFIDEVHQLPSHGPVVQGLLTACEPSTHRMEGDFGVMNTVAVQWQFATTDRGLLFEAFDTRFVKVELQPYTRGEIAAIVSVHNPDLPPHVGGLVSKYCWRVTREALDFARLVRMEREFSESSWEDAVEAVRDRLGIDKFGLDRKRLAVLQSLGQGPCSIEGLESHARCKVEELKKFVLPPMRQFGDGFDPLVTVASRGYYITRAGLGELDMRGLRHNGESALPRLKQPQA